MPFVLIHGASCTARCWDRLLPLLEHETLALDLAGRGVHADIASKGVSLGDFAALARDDVLSRGLDDIVLVGHSLAGVVLPRVIELLPELIRHVVLVSALAPPHGTRVLDRIDPDIRVQVEAAIAGGIYAQTTEAARVMLCNDMDEEQAAWTLSQLVPDSAAVLAEAVDISGYARPLPRSYVVLERDACYPPELQRESAQRIGAHCYQIDCGHMAMVTRAPELAAILNRIHG